MKKLMLAVVLAVALMLGGCEEGISPAEQIQDLTAQIENFQKQINGMQEVAKQVEAEIQAAGLVDEEAAAKLAKINADIDKAQAQMDLIATALKNVQLTGDDAQDIIAQLQAANAASSGVNPYAAPIGAGLTALSIILGLVAKWKANEAAAAEAKYKAHKQGVEKTNIELQTMSTPSGVTPDMVAEVLYNNIGKARANNGV